MINPDTFQKDSEYHINFKNAKAKFDSGARSQLNGVFADVRKKIMSIKLDPVAHYLAQHYSSTGRPAKNQAQILRSLILFVLLFNQTGAKLSLTKWVNETLSNSPVLIALIGCNDVYSLPPLGSYYDFAYTP